MHLNKLAALSLLSILVSPQSAEAKEAERHADKTEAIQWAEGIEPTEGYLARRAEYLNYCAQNSSPEKNGGVYGQLCRLETDAGALNESEIYKALDKINNREDTADFRLNALLRMMLMYGDHPAISETLHQDLEDAILNFKYWIDEPGPDMMCWWSENHQILFHAAEMMAGTLYPDRVFTNSGMTGEQHVVHALPLLNTWLDRRAMFGFSEWHSNVYLNEDIPAILNVVDFSADEQTATKAAMVMDLVTLDLASNYYKGVLATAHGRTYEGKRIGGATDSTNEAAFILFDGATYKSSGNFAATHLATSQKYWPPAILENLRQDSTLYHEHRQRDGIDIAEGPNYDIGFTDYEDVMFWWGMGAYAATPVIDGTFEAVEYYNLWESFLWSDLTFLKPLVGSRLLTPLAAYFDEISRGSALETMNTYTWRTPNYQLSGAQDYNPGLWGAQAHVWEAVIDKDALVFTTYPGGSEEDYAAGLWTGGWFPRATMHQNVGIFQYYRDDFRILDDQLFVDYTHAYFPKSGFDTVEQIGKWTFGQKGDAYVALYSDKDTAWSTNEERQDYELVAQGKENVWIIELGSDDEFGSYDAFKSQMTSALVEVEYGDVIFDSPSLGFVSVGNAGPMSVSGQGIDMGPYDRWSNAYVQQSFGTEVTEINFENQQLLLDFNEVTRTYSQD